MKKNCKKIIEIVNCTNDESGLLVTGDLLYKGVKIGKMEMSMLPYPKNTQVMGAPYNTNYTYVLIFDKKCNNEQKNIALNCVSTFGFYTINSGIMVIPNALCMPFGTYVNIGQTPQEKKYKLTLNYKSDSDMKIQIEKENDENN
jgi:hypothetical protein